MLGPVERMREDISLNQHQRHELDLISRNGRSLLRQVNDLLDVAKLESHDIQPRRTRFELRPWISELVQQIDPVATECELRFGVAADEAMFIDADANMIAHIVINLLLNAFKFMPAGGEAILQLARDADHLLLTVDDSGPGIAEEARELVFERFRQTEAVSPDNTAAPGSAWPSLGTWSACMAAR